MPLLTKLFDLTMFRPMKTQQQQQPNKILTNNNNNTNKPRNKRTDYFEVETIGSHSIVLNLKLARCKSLISKAKEGNIQDDENNGNENLIWIEIGTAPIDCNVPIPSPFIEPNERRKSITLIENECIIWKRFQHNSLLSMECCNQSEKQVTVKHLNPNSKYSLRLVCGQYFTTEAIEFWTTDLPTDDKHPLIVDENVEFGSLYKTGRRLGTGNFGDVYLCTYNNPEQHEAFELYAVKRVKLVRKEKKESAKMEVEILNQIRHPNIVWLKHVVWESKQWAYLVLELLVIFKVVFFFN